MQNKDDIFKSKNYCSGNSAIGMSTILFSDYHMYRLFLLWEMKTKKNANKIMLYFLRKRNCRCSSEKLRKIWKHYRKKRNCWYFWRMSFTFSIIVLVTFLPVFSDLFTWLFKSCFLLKPPLVHLSFPYVLARLLFQRYQNNLGSGLYDYWLFSFTAPYPTSDCLH